MNATRVACVSVGSTTRPSSSLGECRASRWMAAYLQEVADDGITSHALDKVSLSELERRAGFRPVLLPEIGSEVRALELKELVSKAVEGDGVVYASGDRERVRGWRWVRKPGARKRGACCRKAARQLGSPPLP